MSDMGDELHRKFASGFGELLELQSNLFDIAAGRRDDPEATE